MSLGKRRAASAVEFALCLPFVLLLLIGSTDFALWAHAHQTLSRATQDGARVGAAVLVPEAATGTEIVDAAEAATIAAMTIGGFDPGDATVAASWDVDGAGVAWLTVVATAPYTSILGTGPFDAPITKAFAVVTQEQIN